jgi:hypothetical protein
MPLRQCMNSRRHRKHQRSEAPAFFYFLTLLSGPVVSPSPFYLFVHSTSAIFTGPDICWFKETVKQQAGPNVIPVGVVWKQSWWFANGLNGVSWTRRQKLGNSRIQHFLNLHSADLRRMLSATKQKALVAYPSSSNPLGSSMWVWPRPDRWVFCLTQFRDCVLTKGFENASSLKDNNNTVHAEKWPLQDSGLCSPNTLHETYNNGRSTSRVIADVIRNNIPGNNRAPNSVAWHILLSVSPISSN